MLLTLVRKIHRAYIRTRDYNFSLDKLVGFELQGKKAGIVGAGKIGKCFAGICRGFGMEVCAFDKYPDYSAEFEYMPLDKLLSESDIISLHLPLGDESFHMINDRTLTMMKKGAVIINTSRGGLIDTEALLSALKSGKLGGACLDVYEEENEIFFEDKSFEINKDDMLERIIALPNVIVTSHQGFLTHEALDMIAKTTVADIAEFFSGKIPENAVKFSVSAPHAPAFEAHIDLNGG